MIRKNSRAAQGSGTIRQRTDGRWEGRYTVGRDPGTGKQKQCSIYGQSQQEVRKKLAAAITSIDEGMYLEPSKLSVGSWLDVWLREYNMNVKPQTLICYQTQVHVHIKPALGAIQLTKLTAHIAQVFVNSLTKGKKGKPGLSPKSIKNVHSVLFGAMA